MPLLSSTLPLRLLVALTQAPASGLTLRALARSAEVTDSTAHHAMGTLTTEGLAAGTGKGPRSRYGPAESRRAVLVLALARETLSLEDLVALATRANPAVEFAAVDRRGLLVVFGDDADPRDAHRFTSFLRELEPTPRLTADFHGEVVRRLRTDRALRRRALAARVIKGSVDRSLPDRTRHGDFTRAARLGRPHPALRMPSRRTLQRLARRHRLRGLSLFGSSVRTDFRPDSDVDVIVEYLPEAERGIREHLALERDLERFFAHDVDLVSREYLDDKVRPIAEREEVRIHGPKATALARRTGASERATRDQRSGATRSRVDRRSARRRRDVEARGARRRAPRSATERGTGGLS